MPFTPGDDFRRSVLLLMIKITRPVNYRSYNSFGILIKAF